MSWKSFVDIDALIDGDEVEYEFRHENGEREVKNYLVRKTSETSQPYMISKDAHVVYLYALTRSGNHMAMSGDRKGQILGVVKRVKSRPKNYA